MGHSRPKLGWRDAEEATLSFLPIIDDHSNFLTPTIFHTDHSFNFTLSAKTTHDAIPSHGSCSRAVTRAAYTTENTNGKLCFNTKLTSSTSQSSLQPI